MHLSPMQRRREAAKLCQVGFQRLAYTGNAPLHHTTVLTKGKKSNATAMIEEQS